MKKITKLLTAAVIGLNVLAAPIAANALSFGEIPTRVFDFNYEYSPVDINIEIGKDFAYDGTVHNYGYSGFCFVPNMNNRTRLRVATDIDFYDPGRYPSNPTISCYENGTERCVGTQTLVIGAPGKHCYNFDGLNPNETYYLKFTGYNQSYQGILYVSKDGNY